MTEADTDTGAEPTEEVSGPIVVRVFGRTDVGLVREHNEDNFLIADLTRGNRSIKPEVRTHVVGTKGSLFAVCDGMGGAAAGEVASRIAVDTIYEMMQEGGDPSDDQELARRLDAAIHEAGSRIYTAARLNRGQRGMGTTVTAAVLIGPRLLVGQVGDSRGMVVRQGEIVQVTKDQSLVQQLIDAKQLTEEEAKNFDKSNIILQALGTTEEVHVDMTSVQLQQGDVLVMCSDGLSGLVEPEAIRDAVLEIEDPMEACRKLTDMACDGGGDDNITVIVARFDGSELAAESAGDHVGYERFEYPKVGEVTVRSGYPRDPTAPAEDEGDQAAPAQAEATAEQPQEQAAEAEKPAPAEAAEGGAETAEPQAAGEAAEGARVAPEAAARPPESEADGGEPVGKRRMAPVLASVAVVLIGGVIAAYFLTRGSAADQGLPQPSEAMLPAAQSAQPVAPLQPVPAPGSPPIEAPPLNPIDEQDIMGTAKRPSVATDRGTDAAAPGKEHEAEEEAPEEAPDEQGSLGSDAEAEQALADGEGGGSEAEADTLNKKKAGGKKSGKKKKSESLIPDNPFD